MNHVYRVIFNRVLGVWQAVTEIAKSQGKIGGAIKRHARKLAAIAAMASGAGAAAQPAPNQLPQGGQVAAGNITIQQSGAQMQVNQTTQKGIVNWQSFDVGSQASVHFNQPNADAATLNRVNSVTASQIYGQISAVGKVFLLNSNGVIFGPTARVNVGSLVAGAMKITDADFLAGNYKFSEGKGVITNMGELTAEEGGLIALLAPQVINEGIIRAKKGTIVLAAGEAITLTNLASNVTVVVEKPALDALIENKHLVSAPDGRVFMSAMAAHSLARAVISNTGTVEATGAKRVGDVIRLEGSTVINAGIVDASNNNVTDTNSPNPSSPQGSDITITAKNVKNTGTIKSNGASGGKVTVTAQETVTNQGRIQAKGKTSGKGGVITLNANDIVNEGEINASGQIGGQITITANQIINEGQINADGQIGGQVTLTADEIVSGADSQISARSLDAASLAQTLAQGTEPEPTAPDTPIEILLEMADYVPPQITIDARHQVQLAGKLDVSSLNQDGGVLTIRAEAAQLIDIELTAASTVAMGGLIDIESNTTYLDNALIDVSGVISAGQVFMSAPQPEVPAMPTAPPEPVPIRSSLVLAATTILAESRKGYGGKVTLTADTIDLTHTQILATGDIGGGDIKIGGDWQGRGDLPQAINVAIDKDSTLDASAITNGNGGTIVAWSDITNPESRTIVTGTLKSEGGQTGGDGGKIETSGYDLKVDGITISTKANETAGGKTGQWLLDPRNITISGAAGSGTSGTSNYTAVADSAVINVTTLTTALNSSNVTVFTGTSGTQAGNITVDAAITSGSTYNLELKAANNIIINQDITRSGTGGLLLNAGSGQVSGAGTINLSGGTALSLATGTTLANNISLGAGGATLKFISTIDIDYLIVGGGGGGGGDFYGGGGGGGGMITGSTTVGNGNYTIVVGAGGAGGRYVDGSRNGAGARGGSSSGFGLTALGGGGGGGNVGAPLSGGSGGGGSYFARSGAGALGTADQGNAGGTAPATRAGGGGGGAGGAGGNSNGLVGGSGGAGRVSDITGTTTFYAGGGGGGVTVAQALAVRAEVAWEAPGQVLHRQARQTPAAVAAVAHLTNPLPKAAALAVPASLLFAILALL